MGIHVLIIDDDPIARRLLQVALEDFGCTTAAIGNPEHCRAAIAQQPPDLVFLDLMLGEVSGLDLLTVLLTERLDLWVVLVTAHGAIDTAVEAMRRGAKDYLTKPFTGDQIRLLVTQALERKRLVQQVADLEGRLRSEVPGTDLTTATPAMRGALNAVAKAAGSDSTVLLRGESGTGKGVLARAIHDSSKRAGRPFVTINCPTLSDDLLASELFGHSRGAFTGAVRDQPGRVEAAEGGTLFLDEISEIRPALQAKLLRFLQEREYERVGENRTRRADVRIVAATNRDLDAAVHAGEFREDLYFRLGVVEVRVPPLRERREDIMPLAQRFLRFFAAQGGRRLGGFSPAATRLIESHPWPGNVRELRNAIERAVVFATGSLIDIADLPDRMQSVQSADRGPELGGDCSLAEIERVHIERVIARSGSLDAAARTLGIDPSTLYRKRRRKA